MSDGIELTITHDGHDWVLRHADLTAIDERDCRRETGFTITELLGFEKDTKPGLDTLAGLEWLARRQAGQKISYEEIAANLSNSSNITVDWKTPDGDEPSPE